MLRRTWVWLSGIFAAALGIAPHVLHHVGPLAGAALLGGIGGSLLFGALGFLLAIPFLRRLRRHCGSWRVPSAVLLVMVVVFSVSTFVVGPALSGSDDGGSVTNRSAPGTTKSVDDGHSSHH